MQQLESGNDAEQLLPRVVPPNIRQRINRDLVLLVLSNFVLLRTLVDMPLEHLQQVPEEVDVDEVGESGEPFERGGEERGPVVEFEDAEVQREEEFERLGLVPFALVDVELPLCFPNLLVDGLLLLLGLTSLLRSLLRHRLLCFSSLSTLVVLLLVPLDDTVLHLALAEHSRGRSADVGAEFVLKAEVEERRDHLGPDGERTSANEARDEADEVERVGGVGGGVVLEEVDDRVEALLVAFVPALATETLHERVHDVDGEVEVGLLASEGAEAVEGGGGDGRVFCGRAEKSVSKRENEGMERTGDLSFTQLQEALVGRDESVLPLTLPSNHLRDLRVLFLLGERTDAVSTAWIKSEV